jgi:hypothetical protein
MFASSSSIFFLTCDRCLILLVPAKYTQAKRRQLAAVNVAFQLIGYVFMILWLLPEAPEWGIWKGLFNSGPQTLIPQSNKLYSISVCHLREQLQSLKYFLKW